MLLLKYVFFGLLVAALIKFSLELDELKFRIDAMLVVKLEENRLFNERGELESCYFRYWVNDSFLSERSYNEARRVK